ncbi:hypothetical protein CDD81_5639 [Ophiocordyceps australis]|uniref:MARVEL domain-containing protein n=1 Tax=Ophiocordyceps australis TaxID=1399860 RepID=A0A2C5XIB1_9HYPO|nr:hypothetical protein CDD81_5639 [Ophiocordyceps australis]
MSRRIHGPSHRGMLVRAARAASIAWVLALLLDIGMMIISIMAYTGATSQDDRPIIRRTRITFPQTGHHIQRLEIALAALGLIVHPTLLALTFLRVGRLRRHGSHHNAVGARLVIACFMVPWHLVCLAAWIVCVVLQSNYVPILGSRKLVECNRFGNELSQCGFVSASWIVAMIYCVYHFCLLLVVLAMMHWAQRVVVRRWRSLSSKKVRIVVEEPLARGSSRESIVKGSLDGH